MTASLTCSNCEDGYILADAAADSEHSEPCAVCDGDPVTLLYACELCGRYVSEHEIDAWNVCHICFKEGVKALADEDEHYAAWKAEQLELGREFEWL